MITIDQFHETEMLIGKILSAEKIPETDKLLKLSVDLGTKAQASISADANTAPVGLLEKDIRQIVSGISAYFPDPHVLVGKHVAFVANLEPRKLRGEDSQGMILAVHAGDAFALIEVPDTIPPGTRLG